MNRYQYTSTVKDLLEAEEADRSARSAGAPFRWIVVFLGAAWIVAGVYSFSWSNPSWQPIIWLLLGIGVFYYFVIRPYLRRGRIKESNAPQQNLVLEFRDDCIKLGISGVGDFTRKWEELVEFIDARKGILFYFSDGVVNWIPNRVFADMDERNSFIKLLQDHQSPDGEVDRRIL